MERQEKSALNLDGSSELRERIKAFKYCASSLMDCKKRYGLGGLMIHSFMGDNGKINMSADLPDDAYMEAYFLRFRRFILEKEPSCFRRVWRIISNNSEDVRVHTLSRLQRKIFLKDEFYETFFGHLTKKYNSEDIIDFCFNSIYFHFREPEAEMVREFGSIVSDHGVKVCLWYSVLMGANRVLYLNHLLRDTSMENQYIYVPSGEIALNSR